MDRMAKAWNELYMQAAYLAAARFMHPTSTQLVMPRPQHNIGLCGHEYIIAVLNGHSHTCYEQFWMEVYAFWALCDHLRIDRILQYSSREVMVEEALEIFCYVVDHGVVQWNAGHLFHCSVETINTWVYKVMRALCRLAHEVIRPM